VATAIVAEVTAAARAVAARVEVARAVEMVAEEGSVIAVRVAVMAAAAREVVHSEMVVTVEEVRETVRVAVGWGAAVMEVVRVAAARVVAWEVEGSAA
jgi:hypothetical protein